MQFEAKYQREDQPGWKISKWEDANKLLSYLKPEGPSSACFTLENQNYIQCAGSKTRLTVEIRIYNNVNSYEHFVIGKNKPIGKREKIICSVGPIEVDETQVLKMKDARILIREFIENGKISEKYNAEKINWL